MERIIDEAELDRFLERCDLIIDARSPAEFEEDHITGALNVPMLDNRQRIEIGTLYKQNAFRARKRGAVYALRAIENFLLSDQIVANDHKLAILVYCARGGQRSGALASVLSQIGYSVFRLERGYKTYRAFVTEKLTGPLPEPVWVLHGYTGSLKTAILQSLADRVNVIDLEGCARHRGSLLGDLPGVPQPCQRAFETALLQQIVSCSPDRPTLIEGESRRIGACSIPNGIWQHMREGNQLWLDMPRAVRTANILEGYAEYRDPALMGTRLDKLARYLPRKVLADMRADLDSSDWPALVDRLLEHHYDPLYRRAVKRAEFRLEATSFREAVAAVIETIDGGA